MAERRPHKTGGRKLTKQSDALESDINSIINKFVAHIHLPEGGARPTYGDYSNVDDYHTALNRVNQAGEQFMRLPSSVRKHVNNDPGQFLSMVNDPERRDELMDLGLIEPMIPDPVEPTPPAPATPEVPTE